MEGIAYIYPLSLHDALPILIRGQKVWISRAEHSDLLLLVVRTTPLEQVKKKDRKSTRLNSSHSQISYAVFCLKKKSGSSSHDLPDPRPDQSQKDDQGFRSAP